MTEKEKVTVNNTGIGFSGLLLLIFVCAKIFGIAPIASWSWFWVLAPLWIPFALVFVILLFTLLIFVFASKD